MTPLFVTGSSKLVPQREVQLHQVFGVGGPPPAQVSPCLPLLHTPIKLHAHQDEYGVLLHTAGPLHVLFPYLDMLPSIP